MVRYKLLVKYTEIGAAQIQNTVARSAAFKQAAAAMGVFVEDLFWTLGEYDAILTLASEDEETIVALVVEQSRRGFVRTVLLRAFTEDEFARILTKLPSAPVDLDL
jgi:uncharacterized protein with GYD domain